MVEVVTNAVPDGYEQIDLGGGFQSCFGSVYVDRARSRMGFRVEQRHCNPVGTLHGGALATFADSLVAVVNAGVESGEPHTPTIHLSIDFIAPALAGQWVEAQVILLPTTRSMLFVQAVLTAERTIFARCNAIYRKGKPTSPSPS